MFGETLWAQIWNDIFSVKGEAGSGTFQRVICLRMLRRIEVEVKRLLNEVQWVPIFLNLVNPENWLI